MPPTASQKVVTYDVQERVLCFHGPMLYEAKVLEVRKPEDKKEQPEYKVHYKGWKNTFVAQPTPPLLFHPLARLIFLNVFGCKLVHGVFTFARSQEQGLSKAKNGANENRYYQMG